VWQRWPRYLFGADEYPADVVTGRALALPLSVGASSRQPACGPLKQLTESSFAGWSSSGRRPTFVPRAAGLVIWAQGRRFVISRDGGLPFDSVGLDPRDGTLKGDLRDGDFRAIEWRHRVFSFEGRDERKGKSQDESLTGLMRADLQERDQAEKSGRGMHDNLRGDRFEIGGEASLLLKPSSEF
jgi:hypothetical protein